MLTRRTWRQELRGLYAEPYLNSCVRPEEFEYISFLTWTKNENLGKAKARAEWRNAIAQMQRSNLQILKETATRLNKAWIKNLHKDLENEHFSYRITKRKLENNRHTLHQAVDSVLTKRSRLEYKQEEEILDSALSSGFIAFFGATGGCANAALVHTLNAGLHATALARTPSKLTEMLIAQGIKQATLDTHLTIVQGDVTNVPDVKSALLSKDHTLATQIIFGIGGAATMKMSLKQPILMDNPEICTVAAKTIVEALHEIYTEHPSTANSKPTILVISTTGLSDVKQDVPFGLRTLYHVVLAVPHKDKKLMENLVVEEAVGQKTFRASIVVRASLMTGDQDVKSGKGYKKLKVGTEEKPALGYSIRRADVGEWIFAETIRTGGESYYNQKVTLTN
ncbi:hypothetical protein BGZ83_002986 [Gryganskiella cystojenkinii]|nr:hypothetical protein BGZ83_002986 [Gryganskiella cystojenkinii]